ncbi:hypothetical protein PV325_008544 [Microctonus aethiopoides]|nr:hypothetical protein PV325_008544 [Microctonus aethiopoides]
MAMGFEADHWWLGDILLHVRNIPTSTYNKLKSHHPRGFSTITREYHPPLGLQGREYVDVLPQTSRKSVLSRTAPTFREMRLLEYSSVCVDVVVEAGL